MEGETIIFFGNSISADTFGWIILVIGIWELIWKSIAIYMSAGRGSRWWSVAILVFNTIGILPILYIFFFAEKVESVEVESISMPEKDVEVNGR